ncbi:MAG: efflux RND transporter periplasmic adaptor subunit [Sphingobacteriaceae bacterium]
MKRILYISVALLVAACGSNSGDKQAQLEKLKKERAELNQKIAELEGEVGAKAAIENTKQVTVFTVQETTFRNYLEVQGKVDADQNVQVSPEAQGLVTVIYVKPGQAVSKGQVLAQLDDQVLRQSIDELQTQLELASTLFQRQKNLWDQKIGTEVQYLSAKTQRDGLVRRMKTLQSQVALYRIKSPINGVVDQMDLKVGQAVTPGMPGVRVVNTSSLKAKAMVAESYASRVNQGDEVNLIFPDIPDTLNTKLSFAAKTIDQASRSFSVEVKLPSKSSYRANMVAVLKIVDYKKDKAITVPVNAIQKSETGDYVFIADGGKAKRAVIKVGKISDSTAEVLLGLTVGDKVILSGLSDLNEGDLIKF